MREIYEELLVAIREHSGMDDDEIRDVVGVGRGADAGYPGFTYTTDGAEFYRANDELIDQLAWRMAEDLGYASVAEFVAAFGRADMADTRDGRDCLMAWFALEETSRWLQDRRWDDGDEEE